MITYIYIHHIPGDNIQYDNFLHLLMVNVWQRNVHPGPTWIFWSFGRNVCCITKKPRPRSSGNLLASPQRWGPVATVRGQWRDSDNPERSHELWNLNTFSEARNTLEYMGWVVVNGVYRFQVNWPTLDEIFGGSTTYYRMNLPTLSGNLKTWSCLIWNYVVCCDLLGVNKYSPPPHIHAQLVCVLSLPKSQELNPGSPANNWPLVLKTQRTGSGNGSGKRWMEKKNQILCHLGLGNNTPSEFQSFGHFVGGKMRISCWDSGCIQEISSSLGV